jgi:hypothetical protein
VGEELHRNGVCREKENLQEECLHLELLRTCCAVVGEELHRNGVCREKENLQEECLHLEHLRTSNDCVRLLSEVLLLRECADKNGRHLTDTTFRK